MKKRNGYKVKPINTNGRKVIGDVPLYGFSTVVDVFEPLAGEEMHSVAGKTLVSKFKNYEEKRQEIVFGGYTAGGIRVVFCYQSLTPLDKIDDWVDCVMEGKSEQEKDAERERLKELHNEKPTYAIKVDCVGYEHIYIEG